MNLENDCLFLSIDSGIRSSDNTGEVLIGENFNTLIALKHTNS